MNLISAITINVLLYCPIYVARQYEVISKPLYDQFIWILSAILVCLVIYYFKKTVLYMINFCSPEGKLINLKQDICELKEWRKHNDPTTPGYHKKDKQLKEKETKLKSINTQL